MPSQTKPSNETLLDLFDQQNQAYNRKKVEQFIAQDHNTSSSSILINCLSAIGVIFAASFIIASLFILEIFRTDNSFVSILIGCLTLSYTVLHANAAKKTQTQYQDRSALKEQLILASLAVGKFFICWGVATMLPSKTPYTLWALAATMTALTTLTYFTVNNAINRFFAPLITMTLWLLAYSYHAKHLIYPDVIFPLFYVVLLTVALWLHLKGNLKSFTNPLAHAALIFTCTIIPISLETDAFIPLPTWADLFGMPLINLTVTIALALGMLATLHHITKQHGQPQRGLTILTCATISILCFFGMQNILAALIILTIGYYKFARPLLVIGTISFIYFLSSYYYSLNATLLYKSGVLLASGLCFLAAWAYLHFIANKKAPNKGEAK